MRHTRGHTGNRRSHHALAGVRVVKDAASGNLRLPHRIDEATGMYGGKQILTPKAKSEHKAKAKGSSTAPAAKRAHEHAQERHANAEARSARGITEKVAAAGRPKARSGFGGGA